MSRAHTRTTTAESLRRWLAAWLALALCAQAFAVGSAGLRGLGHRHGTLEIRSQPMLLWHHGDARAHSADAHARAHAAGEAHWHAHHDASVLGSDAHAAAVAAFVGAPAPRAHAALSVVDNGLRHVWMAARSWSPTAHTIPPPHHPPRT